MPNCLKIRSKNFPRGENKEEPGEEEVRGKRRKKQQKGGVDERKIRRLFQQELHEEMDKQIAKKHWRYEDVALHKDTTEQWDLVTAAVE